jgi:AraC-like DNA-binding protein
MVLVVEPIEYESESFRLLSWSKSTSKVEIVGPRNSRRRIRGLGDLWHAHQDVELTLFESGAGTRVVGDSTLPMSEPELVMIGPHVPHCWNCYTDSRGLSLQFSIEPGNPLRGLPEWELLADLMHDSQRGLIFSPATVGKVGVILQRMIGEARLTRLASFIEVLSTLDRGQAQPLSSKSFAAPDTTTSYPDIQKAVLEILSRFQEDISLMDMVAMTHLSRATFCREFKNYTDRTFVRFLNEVRINWVRQQLLRTDDPVSDIAFAAGFDNLSHFNRVFRRLMGTSPRDFRNRFSVAPNSNAGGTIIPLGPESMVRAQYQL